MIRARALGVEPVYESSVIAVAAVGAVRELIIIRTQIISAVFRDSRSAVSDLDLAYQSDLALIALRGIRAGYGFEALPCLSGIYRY